MFIIGHGIGTIASYFSNQNCISAEINETVAQWSKQYFNCPETVIRIGDGRSLLESEQGLFDYIIIDAFTSKGVPEHLSTKSFFQLAKSKLYPDGALLINVISRGKQDVLSNAMHSTLLEVFPHTEAFMLPSENNRDIRNALFIGSNQALRYQLRSMAGFIPFKPEPGFILLD